MIDHEFLNLSKVVFARKVGETGRPTGISASPAQSEHTGVSIGYIFASIINITGLSPYTKNATRCNSFAGRRFLELETVDAFDVFELVRFRARSASIVSAAMSLLFSTS